MTVRAERMGTRALLKGEGHNIPVEDSSTACGIITRSATIVMSRINTMKETRRAD
jgi:hypothetical protein